MYFMTIANKHNKNKEKHFKKINLNDCIVRYIYSCPLKSLMLADDSCVMILVCIYNAVYDRGTHLCFLVQYCTVWQ